VAHLAASDVDFAHVPGRPVVQGVSVEVAGGEVLFLLGHNGSGKSSLLGCLAGLHRPSAGRVRLDGADVHALPSSARARRLGVIPQLHVAAFAYDVLQVVLMGRAPHLGTFEAPGASDEAIALDALALVGLADFRDRRYTELSGGERQLVLVARGLAQRCDVLLMDEPDAHLDPRNQFRVLEVVSDLARRRGLAVVVASHAPNSALMFADRVLLLRQGRTLAQGAVADTLTEELLGAAYGMPTEVVTKVVAGRRVPRAILPRRIDRVADEVDTIAVGLRDVERPDGWLARAFEAGGGGPRRLVVTGARGSGKSRWCAALVAAARAGGRRVAGVVSPAVFDPAAPAGASLARAKVAIDLVDLASGERRRLAEVRRDDDPGTATQRWRFDEAALAWGNGALRAAAGEDVDLLVVDELGPLEFVRGVGFTDGLAAIDAGRFAVACAVVRPSLVDEALRRWPDATVVDVED
jgi:ABC-type cobalamin/Fe3+-siderophores transport system ATPase subunit/nucleoside-triphosphatase THEP1